MKSQIQGDDNVDIEEGESRVYCNSSDVDTPTDNMNRSSNHDDLNSMESSSSPMLQSNLNVVGVAYILQPLPQRTEEQKVVDQHIFIPTTNKKRSSSND